MKQLLAMLTLIMSFYTVAEEVTDIDLVCAEWPGYTNSDGTGVYWEIIKRVYQPIGIDVHTQTVPWKRAQYSVKNGKKDAYVGDYFDPSKDRKEFLYPKEHLSIEEPVVVVFSNRHTLEWKAKGKSMLTGMRVAWVRGYGFEDNLLDGIALEHKDVNHPAQAILLLKKGRVDAVVDYRSNIMDALADDADSYTLSLLEKGQKLYLVFANTQKSVYLAALFDRRIREMRASGDVSEIYKQYGKALPIN